MYTHIHVHCKNLTLSMSTLFVRSISCFFFQYFIHLCCLLKMFMPEWNKWCFNVLLCCSLVCLRCIHCVIVAFIVSLIRLFAWLLFVFALFIRSFLLVVDAATHSRKTPAVSECFRFVFCKSSFCVEYFDFHFVQCSLFTGILLS